MSSRLATPRSLRKTCQAFNPIITPSHSQMHGKCPAPASVPGLHVTGRTSISKRDGGLFSSSISRCRSISTSSQQPPEGADNVKKSTPGGSKQRQHQHHEEEQPDLGQISFEGLGMSKTTKTIVYVLVGIYGTFETIFWAKAIMRWYYGAEDNENE